MKWLGNEGDLWDLMVCEHDGITFQVGWLGQTGTLYKRITPAPQTFHNSSKEHTQ